MRTTTGIELAQHNPVARVHVLGSLPHLDRAFEYAVPAELDQLKPGQRVRVSFAGRDAEGIVRARGSQPETDRALAPIKRIVSPDQVIDESMLRVCELIAERYAGSLTDVLRLAVPPRHARAEKRVHDALAAAAASDDRGDAPAEPAVTPTAEAEGQPELIRPIIERFPALTVFLDHARDGGAPRASILLDPVDDWHRLAEDLIRGLADTDGILILAPDARDVRRAAEYLRGVGLDCAELTSSEGPEKRYGTFLRILTGQHRIIVGTRSAAFAPVKNLRLILMWDEADDLFDEPRAPYPHARAVVMARSYLEGVPAVFAVPSRSAALTVWAREGALADLDPIPAPHTLTHPRIELMDEHLREREGASGWSRLPQHAYRVIREGLKRGPVLVQVPRSGYVPALVCSFCGTRALCTHCHAGLQVRGRGGMLVCPVCGHSHGHYRCPECDRTHVTPVVSGSVRTADDLRRAFPTTPFHVSGGAGGMVADSEVADGDIVVATPGAEPLPAQKYAATVILDADAALARSVFDADVEAVRRWSHAIGATRVFDDGGQVLVVGTAQAPAIRSLVLPRGRFFINTVLQQREELLFPPFAKVVEVSGDADACREFLELMELPGGAGVYGPVETEDDASRSRAVLRAPLSRSEELVAVVRAAVMVRSAKKLPGQLRIQVDPAHVF